MNDRVVSEWYWMNEQYMLTSMLAYMASWWAYHLLRNSAQ